jgi:DNA-binding MarR family transcriptional regulator
MNMEEQDRLIQIISRINQAMKIYIVGEFSRNGIQATPTQTAILYLLEQNDGQKISDFASSLEIKNPVMTGVIDRMEKAGLIIRKPNPSDRRTISIYITPQGREESSKARDIISKMNKKIESGLSDQEIEACQKVLYHLYQEIKQLK